MKRHIQQSSQCDPCMVIQGSSIQSGLLTYPKWIIDHTLERFGVLINGLASNCQHLQLTIDGKRYHHSIVERVKVVTVKRGPTKIVTQLYHGKIRLFD